MNPWSIPILWCVLMSMQYIVQSLPGFFGVWGANPKPNNLQTFVFILTTFNTWAPGLLFWQMPFSPTLLLSVFCLFPAFHPLMCTTLKGYINCIQTCVTTVLPKAVPVLMTTILPNGSRHSLNIKPDLSISRFSSRILLVFHERFMDCLTVWGNVDMGAH